MRVLLTTYGSRGDVEPMAALAVQLQELGAEVRVCAPPDEEFAELLARAGVPLVPFDRPWRSWTRPPATAEERDQRVADFIAVQFDTVMAAAEGSDLLVATGMSHFVAPSVAEVLDVPYRYAIFAPRVLDGLEVAGWNALFGRPVNRHRESIGLPPVDDVREFLFTAQPFLAADPALGPREQNGDVEVVQTGAWVLPDERALPPSLETFLREDEPPVYVGFGSMRTVTDDGARAAIEAIRGLGRRTLLASGWAGLAVADGNDDCLVVGEINQQALFPHVAAVVHHGGAGTTTAAARAGTPQVVVPQAGDQTYWGDRVAELGIGVAHVGPAPTAESLTVGLRSALSTETRTQAEAVAGWTRSDGARVAAELMLETIEHGRSVASV